MSKVKAKKKNKDPLRSHDMRNKKFTYDEVMDITKKIEHLAIGKMSDACFFAHSIALIVLQDEFGFGPKRRAKFIAEFNRYCRDYADGKFTYDDAREIGTDLEAACDRLIEEVMR